MMKTFIVLEKKFISKTIQLRKKLWTQLKITKKIEKLSSFYLVYEEKTIININIFHFTETYIFLMYAENLKHFGYWVLAVPCLRCAPRSSDPPALGEWRHCSHLLLMCLESDIWCYSVVLWTLHSFSSQCVSVTPPCTYHQQYVTSDTTTCHSSLVSVGVVAVTGGRANSYHVHSAWWQG